MRNRTKLALIGAGILFASATSMSYAQTATDSLYTVKFICGTQRPRPNLTAPAEPPVKPGNYATVINVEGLGSVDTAQAVGWSVSVANATITGLGPALSLKRFQTADITCFDIANAVSTLATNGFITGFVNIQSAAPISVTSVYTSQGCNFPLGNTGLLPAICSGAVSTDVVPQQPVPNPPAS